MELRVSTPNPRKLLQLLVNSPREIRNEGMKAFADYLIGDRSHGFRHDEPYRYISRQQAGYKTSAAQRRFFFAVGIWRKMFGSVAVRKYHRTGETAAAWHAVRVSDFQYKLVNTKAGAYWTRDDSGQTRQHKLAGRRKVSKVIDDNKAGAYRAAQQTINAYLRKKTK